MKKLVPICLLVLGLSAVLIMGAAAPTTRMSSYVLADTYTATAVTTAEGAIATTGFYVGSVATDADVDLLSVDGGGRDSYANNIALTFTSNDADNSVWVIMIYGAVDGGSWEPIASLSITMGGGLYASGIRYPDAIVATEYHLTDIITPTVPADSVAKVAFDATGYRYLRFACTTSVTETKYIKTYYRWF